MIKRLALVLTVGAIYAFWWIAINDAATRALTADDFAGRVLFPVLGAAMATAATILLVGTVYEAVRWVITGKGPWK